MQIKNIFNIKPIFLLPELVSPYSKLWFIWNMYTYQWKIVSRCWVSSNPHWRDDIWALIGNKGKRRWPPRGGSFVVTPFHGISLILHQFLGTLTEMGPIQWVRGDSHLEFLTASPPFCSPFWENLHIWVLYTGQVYKSGCKPAMNVRDWFLWALFLFVVHILCI